jgi:hypothetical protein
MDFSNESAINELEVNAACLRQQLAIVEKKIKNLMPDVESLVIAIETRNDYKRGWKKVVHQGLFDNVSNILEECYEYFTLPGEMNDEFIAKAKNMMGTINSFKWKNFTLEVIKYLHKKGSFYDDGGEFDNFEDTAGGCDEITQDAAMHLIENSIDSYIPSNPTVNTVSTPSPVDKDS